MQTLYGKVNFTGIAYGMYGDIIGRPYESAFFFLLRCRPDKRITSFYDQLVDSLRTSFPFEKVQEKWLKITGRNLLWNSLQKFMDREGMCTPYSDDTVLTAATIEALNWATPNPFAAAYRSYGRKYPDAGFSRTFTAWFKAEKSQPPYGATTNGSAMRVSPIGYLPLSLDELLSLARLSAEVTHNSYEAVLGAEIVVETIYMIRREGKPVKEVAEKMLHKHFRGCTQLPDEAPKDKFEYECLPTVKLCLTLLLRNPYDFEKLLLSIIRYGGDTDTIAMICGSIFGASTCHSVLPSNLYQELHHNLPDKFFDMIHW